MHFVCLFYCVIEAFIYPPLVYTRHPAEGTQRPAAAPRVDIGLLHIFFTFICHNSHILALLGCTTHGVQSTTGISEA